MPRTFQQVLTRTFTSSLVAGVLFAASTHGMPKLAQANQPAIVAPASLAYAPNLPASIGKPYLSEVSPAGSAAWVEIALEHTSVYLPLVQRGADAALDKAIGNQPNAINLPGLSLTGWQVVTKNGSGYTIPASLPALPLNGILVIVFDGQGTAADDLDFGDGIATLHASAANPFDANGDQLALYSGVTKSASTLADFVAWGATASNADETNAVDAGLWGAGDFVVYNGGFGAGGIASPAAPNQSIAVPKNAHAQGAPDWAGYLAANSSRGKLNLPAAPLGSTIGDAAVLGGEDFGLAWQGSLNATSYEFQLAKTTDFATPLVNIITPHPGWKPDAPLADGTYFWRVRSIDAQGKRSSYLGPLQVTSQRLDTLLASYAPESVNAVTVTLLSNAQYHMQRKDTTMLDLGGGPGNGPITMPVGSPRFGDDKRWDGPHIDANGKDHFGWNGYDNWYCVRASTAMMNTFYGGNLSEDRISFHIWEEWGANAATLGQPEGDMGFSQGFGSYSSHYESLSWALGNAPLLATSWCPANVPGTYTCTTGGAAPIDWATIKGWLDAGKPFMTTNKNNAHMRVVDGYRILADNSKWVRVLDPVPASCSPECGTSGIRWEAFNTFKEDNERTYVVNGAVSARNDEANISQDSDGDGVNDFDEVNRFHTDALNADSDYDWVNDKADIAEYVFDKNGKYAPRKPDVTNSGKRKELNWDNDADVAPDGCEDVNANGMYDLGESNNFSKFSKQACAPRFTIVAPTTSNAANAGDLAIPDKVLVRVSMALPKSLPSAPTFTANQFSVSMGGKPAAIVSGASVGAEFWLLTQAPTQTASTFYSLSVAFNGVMTDTQNNAVYYIPRPKMDTMLVVDVSGSMSDLNKLTSAKNAARLYADQWNSGDAIGLVTFSDTAHLRYALSPIAASLQQISDTKNLIDGLVAGGQTAMGAGLKLGQQQLTAAGGADHDWSMMLLTDGQENVAPYWSDPTVKTPIVNAKTIVNTIGLGPATSAWFDNLAGIAGATGGTFGAVDTTGLSLNLSMNAPEAAEALPTTLPNQLADSYKYAAEQILRQQRFFEISGTVSLENTTDTHRTFVGKWGEAIFTANFAGKSAATLELFRPGGTKVNPTDSDVDFRNDPTHTQYRIKQPESGYWLMVVRYTGTPGVAVFNDEYLLIGAAHTPLTMNFGVGALKDGKAPLLAMIADDKPVKGASVNVVVKYPNSFVSEPIQLIDDGAHGDGAAGDGIYGGEFAPLPSIVGTFLLKAKATGNGNDGTPFERHAQGTLTQRKPAAFIYTNTTDLSIFNEYKTLLAQDNVPLVGVPMSAVPSTTWSSYALIIVGADTGSQELWGTSPARVALLENRTPILGLGEGGYALFGAFKLAIGYPNGWHASDNATVPISPTASVWSSPFTLTSLPGALIYPLYSASADVAIAAADFPANVVPIGREVAAASVHYNIIAQSRYTLWGFQARPKLMTENGQHLFLNVVDSMLP